MLVPKKLKYRKPHRGRMRGQAKGGTDVQFGEYGLQALEPAWTRMGSGKGSPENYVAVVKPGRVMFEMSGVNEQLARDAMALAAQKLPIKTRFLVRGGAST